MSRAKRQKNDRLWGPCRRKVRHRSVEEVEKKRLEMEQRTGERLTWYACSICGCYHLTKDRGAA